MSNNKSKYFEVVTISSVRADNMADARKAAVSSRRIPGTEVMGRATTVERIYATEARELADRLDNS